MPTATKPPRPMPPVDQQVVDPKTGRMNQAWYDYFKLMDALVRAIRLEIP